MYVCAYATLKFSVPKSLCMTHGTPRPRHLLDISTKNDKDCKHTTKSPGYFEILCADIL
jgi:hypothetical protein